MIDNDNAIFTLKVLIVIKHNNSAGIQDISPL